MTDLIIDVPVLQGIQGPEGPTVFRLTYVFVTANYTLQVSDEGKVVVVTSAGAVTVTLPNNLPVGFVCTVLQAGAGGLTFAPASGSSAVSRGGFLATNAQWSEIGAKVLANVGGAAAQWHIAGPLQ